MDRKAFLHLCELARLELTPEEEGGFEQKFNKLLEFVDQVREYEPGSQQEPLTLVDKLSPRRDTRDPFEWPEGFVHEYRVPMIIDFEEGG